MRSSFKLGLLILAILTLKLGDAQEENKSEILSITPQQDKHIGESVELNCTIRNSGGYHVSWMKRQKTGDSTILALNTQLLFTSGSKYEYRVTNKSGIESYCLTINNITLDDAGSYEFQIQVTPSIKIPQSVDLLVRHPPTIADKTSLAPIVTRENLPVQLVCEASGFPRPEISWKRENDAILPVGGHVFVGNILKIKAVRREDRGMYFCVANNGIGEPDIKRYGLDVEFPPTISVPRPKVAQALDYNIKLECRVLAYPAPAVSWFKNDQELHNTDDYRIATMGSPDNTHSILEILTIENFQFGDYYCKASNKIGNAEARINVFELKQPNIYFSGLRWTNGGNSLYMNRNIIYPTIVLILATLSNQ